MRELELKSMVIWLGMLQHNVSVGGEKFGA